jgi:hypothetical protein
MMKHSDVLPFDHVPEPNEGNVNGGDARIAVVPNTERRNKLLHGHL